MVWKWVRSHTVGFRPKRERLEAEIPVTRERVRKRAALGAAASGAEPAWVAAAEAQLALAAEKVAERRIDGAWKHLHEARRQEVFGYSDEEVTGVALALRNEVSHKLKGWRQVAIVELLDPLLAGAGSGVGMPAGAPVRGAGPAGDAAVGRGAGAVAAAETGDGRDVSAPAADEAAPAAEPGGAVAADPAGAPRAAAPLPSHDARRCRLALAMHLRDERGDDIYFKLRLVKGQIVWLLVLMVILLGAFAAFLTGTEPNPLIIDWGSTARAAAAAPAAATGGTAPAAAAPATLAFADLSHANILAAMLLGAIGACFSGLVSLTGAPADVSIPERIASTSVTLARPMIGAISAFVVLLLLSSGLLSQASAGAAFALAFAAGFSERLAIGALERIAPK